MEGMEALEEMVAKTKPSRIQRLLKDTKSVRKTWGGVKPYERIEKNRKAYDRKKNKRILISEED